MLKRSFKKVDHTKICNVAMPELELLTKSFYISQVVSYFYSAIHNRHVWAGMELYKKYKKFIKSGLPNLPRPA